MSSHLELTPRTIVVTILILLGGWLVLQIRDILALLFISYILMTALRPSVDALEKWYVPRFLAIVFMYMVVIAGFVGFGTVVLPPLVAQTVKLVNNLPRLIETVAPFVNIDLNTILQQIAPISSVTIGVFNNVLALFTIGVFTFYFLLEHKNLTQFLQAFVGEELGEKIIRILRKVEERLGAWVRGQAMLAVIIGLASYIGLVLLGVNFALPLALIAGLLEVIPIIGPIISAIPAVLVAITISPGLALAVVALYILIQQLENNIIVPAVMRRAVGIPPLASLLALMIGGRLGGIIGILLSVPVLLVLQTILHEVVSNSQKKE